LRTFLDSLAQAEESRSSDFCRKVHSASLAWARWSSPEQDLRKQNKMLSRVFSPRREYFRSGKN